ncbi:MAG: hypothetical protein RR404_00450 [Bacilli bacterium]
MKKFLFLLLIFINLFLFDMSVTSVLNNTLTVFNDNDFVLYEIYTTTTTKNLLQYVKEPTKIFEVDIENSINYNRINNYKYIFNTSSNKQNIDMLVRKFTQKLIYYGYNKESNLINFNGIKINRIKIYTTQNNLIEMLNTNKFTLNKNP